MTSRIERGTKTIFSINKLSTRRSRLNVQTAQIRAHQHACRDEYMPTEPKIMHGGQGTSSTPWPWRAHKGAASSAARLPATPIKVAPLDSVRRRSRARTLPACGPGPRLSTLRSHSAPAKEDRSGSAAWLCALAGLRQPMHHEIEGAAQTHLTARRNNSFRNFFNSHILFVMIKLELPLRSNAVLNSWSTGTPVEGTAHQMRESKSGAREPALIRSPPGPQHSRVTC